MQYKVLWLVPFSFFLVTGITTADASEWLTMRVSPTQAFAPVNLWVRVQIEPNADNRVLLIVADSSAFYRSSQIQLEGDRAPKTFSIEYPNVPGGEYEVTCMLVNGMGRERATVHETARVVPSGGERQR
jgi:hypothetical protein